MLVVCVARVTHLINSTGVGVLPNVIGTIDPAAPVKVNLIPNKVELIGRVTPFKVASSQEKVIFPGTVVPKFDVTNPNAGLNCSTPTNESLVLS